MSSEQRRDAEHDLEILNEATDTISMCSLCQSAGSDEECHADWGLADADVVEGYREARGVGCPKLESHDAWDHDNPGMAFLDSGAWALGLGGK